MLRMGRPKLSGGYTRRRRAAGARTYSDLPVGHWILNILTPPIEVRRQAKADCVAEGYEVAVVDHDSRWQYGNRALYLPR